MKPIENPDWKKVYGEFREKAYSDKLALFDRLFELIKFRFPAVTPGISWYEDGRDFHKLMDIYLEERKTASNLLEEKVMADGELLVFNITPVQIPERLSFNKYLFEKFLSQKTILQRTVNKQLSETDSKRTYIEERIAMLSQTFERVPRLLQVNENSYKTQFLKLVNNGIQAAKHGLEGAGKTRKKYVEQYLFSYGFLLVDHFNWLLNVYKKYGSDHTPEPISLEKKIILMKELGIFEYLKNELQTEGSDNFMQRLASIVSLFTAESRSNYSQVFQLLSQLYADAADEQERSQGYRSLQGS